MEKLLLCSVATFLFIGCTMNSSTEDRIQELEAQLQESSEKLDAL